jgi:WD40 repeat protein
LGVTRRLAGEPTPDKSNNSFALTRTMEANMMRHRVLVLSAVLMLSLCKITHASDDCSVYTAALNSDNIFTEIKGEQTESAKWRSGLSIEIGTKKYPCEVIRGEQGLILECNGKLEEDDGVAESSFLEAQERTNECLSKGWNKKRQFLNDSSVIAFWAHPQFNDIGFSVFKQAVTKPKPGKLIGLLAIRPNVKDVVGSVNLNSDANMPRLVANIGHPKGVAALASSRSNGLLVSVGRDGIAKLWSLREQRELRSIREPVGKIQATAISPDGQTVYSADEYGQILIWNSRNGQIKRTLRENLGAVKAIVLSEDGKTMISLGYGNSIRIWDTSSNQLSRSIRVLDFESLIHSIAISPDKKRFAASFTLPNVLGSGESAIGIWNLETGTLERKLEGHKSTNNFVEFSKAGANIISAGNDGTIRIWSVSEGNVLKTIRTNQNTLSAMALDHDSDQLYLGGTDGSLASWNLSLGKLVKSFTKQGDEISSIIAPVNFGYIYFSTGSGGISSITKSNLEVGIFSKTSEFAGRAAATGGLHNFFAVSDNGDLLSINFSSGEISNDSWRNSEPRTTSGSQTAFESKKRLDVMSLAASKNDEQPSMLIAEGDEFLWKSSTTKSSLKIKPPSSKVFWAALLDDGRHVMYWDTNGILVEQDLISSKETKRVSTSDDEIVGLIRANRTRTRVLTGEAAGDSATLYDWTEKTPKVISRISLVPERAQGESAVLTSEIYAAFFQNSARVVVGAENGLLKIVDSYTGKVVRTIETNIEISSIALNETESAVILGDKTGYVHFFDLAGQRSQKLVRAHEGAVLSIFENSRHGLIITTGVDGFLTLTRQKDFSIVAKAITLGNGQWALFDSEGRFDTSDLEKVARLHWVMPDDPLTPVPLEAFMKDYYEPRLLARILAGESFKPVRALTTLNRTQPEVKIVSLVREDSDPSIVRVTVSAAGASKSYPQGERQAARSTAVHDLRVFRDGQVVGFADGKLSEFSASPFVKTFSVRLPRTKAGQPVVFSAYAFNDDRVKSETIRSTFNAPLLPVTLVVAKSRAYVISMGVNEHENAAWNLRFAVNDARAVSERVSVDLRKSARYEEVVSMVLTSGGTTRWASKSVLRAVLTRLAGGQVSAGDAAALQGIIGAEQLRKAQPDDLVLISFAGHGFADEKGQFYLLPQDTGEGSGKQITPALKTRSISSEELSLWLRDVDAGDMTMIVDACQSAASVQAEGFKPGPMGSRGLGQLSFDKGMRILAASQSDEFALENDKLKHGLLTFSLIRDGLDDFKADHEPKDQKINLDEWLRYGLKRVPILAEDIKRGDTTSYVASRGWRAVWDGSKTNTLSPSKSAQQPALFDFAKTRQPLELAIQ